MSLNVQLEFKIYFGFFLYSGNSSRNVHCYMYLIGKAMTGHTVGFVLGLKLNEKKTVCGTSHELFSLVLTSFHLSHTCRVVICWICKKKKKEKRKKNFSIYYLKNFLKQKMHQNVCAMNQTLFKFFLRFQLNFFVFFLFADIIAYI